MTDLTVLVSPIPLYPSTKDFSFGLRRKPVATARPIMVTLETEIEPTVSQASPEADADAASSPNDDDDGSHFRGGSQQRGRRLNHRHTVVDPDLLSPPVNTFRASRPTRHRYTRSHSAPPERRTPQKIEVEERSEDSEDSKSDVLVPVRRPTSTTPSASFGRSSSFVGRGGGLGEPVRPAPPLFRPTTFWRKTRRSGVTSASYSPASYLIRRSTYIAAGLTFDKPIHDLSALCVESRVERIICKTTNEEWI